MSHTLYSKGSGVVMERRGFFKSLVGLFALPFVKDILPQTPTTSSLKSSAEFTIIPSRFYWDNTNNLWYWNISNTSSGDVKCNSWTDIDVGMSANGKAWNKIVEGEWISVDEALERWGGT
jgi:hypothetical protein